MLKALLLGALLILAACQQTEPAPDIQQDPAGREITATPPPPGYVEPQAPITLDNVAQIRLLGRLDQPGRASTLFAHSFSPDGTRLAALNNDALLSWDLLNGELLFQTGRGGATNLYYAADKSEIYVLDDLGIVVAYRAGRGTRLNSFRAIEDFEGTHTFDPFAGLLAVGNGQGEVKVWDTFERQSLATFNVRPAAKVLSLAFSPDAQTLAVADAGGAVSLWNWRERERLGVLDHEGTPVPTVIYAPDGEQVATVTQSYTAVWSLADFTLRYALEHEAINTPEVARFSPDNRFLLLGARNAQTTLYEALSGAFVGHLPDVNGDRIGASFSPDGRMLATTVLDKGADIWNLTDVADEEIGRAPIDVGTQRLFTVEWTEDSFTLAFIDATGPVYIWGIGPEAAS